MKSTLDFSILEKKFSNPTAFPELPSAALRLTEMLDTGDASANELERVILGDPSLTVSLLRAATSVSYGVATRPVTTIKQAIMVLGQKSVRNIAVSMWVQSMMCSSFARTPLDPKRFSQHGIFVGFFSRYLFSICRQKEKFPTNLNPDELFAAGVLHEVGTGLLATIDPEVFDKTLRLATAGEVTLASSFKYLTGHSIYELGSYAIKSWGLPGLFSDTCDYLDHPKDHQTESVAMMCMHYANYISNTLGYGLLPRRAKMEIDPEILERVKIPDEDLPGVVMLVANHTRDYIGQKAA